MSEPTPLLDRKGIEEAFRRLGDRLAKRGVVADIYVFSGAAMALAYDSRRATRDVDALFKPHGIVLEEAQAVAAELGLPKLVAERAGKFLRRAQRRSVGIPRVRPPRPPRLRRLTRTPACHEALAARPRDAQDIRQLTEVLNLHTVAEVLALVQDVFPEEEPPPRLRLLLEDIFGQTGDGLA